MPGLIHSWLVALPTGMLLVLLVASVALLGKAADIMVGQAVSLARLWGLPPVIIGATIVSLGTTLPEVVVSVLAALRGSSGIALGNAVGSIICDTGLILGLAAVLSPLPLNRVIVSRQGWIQVAGVCLLVFLCTPLGSPFKAFSEGGVLPVWGGWIFLACLAWYLWLQIRWGLLSRSEYPGEKLSPKISKIIILLPVSFLALALSSEILIVAASEIAVRLSIPESVIAVTLVAFGTSLPELVTAVAAVRKGHGEIAVGNIIGADILNAFLVAGASAAASQTGLKAGPEFFTRSFPVMLLVIIIFRVGISFSGDRLHRLVGVALLFVYFSLVAINLVDVLKAPF